MTATYLTLDDIRGPTGVLDQFTTEGGNANTRDDGLLQACLDDAQAIIDGELGFTLSAAAASDVVVYGDGTVYLTPPAFTAGTAVVTTIDSYVVPDYVEQNGILVTTDANGLITTYPLYPYGNLTYDPFNTGSGVWARGVPYTVTADFGGAAADLLVAKRVTLELAVNLHKFRDAGGAVAVGTETAVVLVKEALNGTMRKALLRLKQKYAPSVGVW